MYKIIIHTLLIYINYSLLLLIVTLIDKINHTSILNTLN